MWTWIDQYHGDMVKVPVGFAHTVLNMQKCVKIAMDVCPAGELHRCTLSYQHAWRQFYDAVESGLTDSYLPYMQAAVKVFDIKRNTLKRK